MSSESSGDIVTSEMNTLRSNTVTLSMESEGEVSESAEDKKSGYDEGGPVVEEQAGIALKGETLVNDKFMAISDSPKQMRPKLIRQMTEPGYRKSSTIHSTSKSFDVNSAPLVDVDAVESCDLGLGLGLKPGGLPPLPECQVKKVKPTHQMSATSTTAPEILSSPPNSVPILNHYYLCERHTPKRKWYELSRRSDLGSQSNSSCSRKVSRQRTKSRSSVSSLDDLEESDISIMCPAFPDLSSRLSDDDNVDLETETFPAFADVPMGTSIRQQKMLFRHDANEILNRSSPLGNSSGSQDMLDKASKFDVIACWKCYEEQDIEDRLRRAEQEVRILRDELDRSQKQLDTKYKAIQILQRQSQIAQCEHDVTNRKVLSMTKAMEQEINKLQFELEYRQSSLMDSQQTWAQRFDKVCQENASLMAALEERTEELRRVHSDKMAACRERDELLALLDVKERLKYEQSRLHSDSMSSDDAYSEFTSNELAVLGACNCRGTCGEPCGCAYAAANLRREIIKLKEAAEVQKRRRDEANTTADAYRMAFEEQLYRNKALTAKVAEITSPLLSTKKQSPLGVVKWLVRQLNDDIPPRKMRSLVGSKSAQKSKNGASTKKSDKSSSKSAKESLDVTNETSEDKSADADTANADTTATDDVDKSNVSETTSESAMTSQTDTSTSDTATTTTVPVSTDTSAALTSSTESSKDVTSNGDAGDVDDDFVEIDSPLEKKDYTSDDIMGIQTEQQLIAYLLERLSEQNELLAHQRLAAKMLATRTVELESRLSMHGDTINDVTPT